MTIAEPFLVHPQTLVGCLKQAGQSHTGVTFEQMSGALLNISYAELNRRAHQYALNLHTQGIRAGDVVAIVLPTGPAFYDAFFGTLAIGACPAPLYPPMRFGHLKSYLVQTRSSFERLQASWVITDARLCTTLAVAVSHGSSVKKVFAHKDDVKNNASSHVELEHKAKPDDLALIQLSSGTTGQPKAVRLTHRQLLANIDAFTAALRPVSPLNGQHSCVSWLPLYHDMGLVGCMLAAVREQAELTLLPPEAFVTNPARWLQAMSRTKATVSAAPNFAYALCNERISDDVISTLDLSHWRVALNGAEPVVPQTLASFNNRFFPCGLNPNALTPVYGLAEAALAVTFSNVDRAYTVRPFANCSLKPGCFPRPPQPHEKAQSLASLGKALDGYQIRVVASEETAESLEPGCVGLIEVRGPSIGEMPEKGAFELSKAQWLATGDLGFLVDGELFIWGRKKDIVIIRGQNFAPQAIETCVGELDFVRTGCVVAASFPIKNSSSESLVILYETRHHKNQEAQPLEIDMQRQQIKQVISQEFGLVPDSVKALASGTLLRTSSGKLRRGACMSAWASGRLYPPRSTKPISILMQLGSAWVKFAWSRKKK